MSSADLTSSLVDISHSLTTNILAENSESIKSGISSSKETKGTTASRELLNTKRKSRDEDEDIATQENFVPLIRAPRKKLRAVRPTSSTDPILSSITQGGATFSINDTSFHNASKNAKVVSKAQRKKNAKGSNYSDRMNAKLSSKQRAKKLKSK